VIGPPRALTRAGLALLLAVSLACSGLLGGVAPSAHAATGYVKESEADFAGQLAAKEVKEVTINKLLRRMSVTLADGRHVFARYPKKQGAQTVARLRARGVRVTVLSEEQARQEIKSEPKHHKIRYIAGAVVIVAIALAGAVLLFNRRRRGRD
jgi:hypothetical protein